MKISVDIDGVLADFGKAANKVANVLWPGRIPEDYEPTDWYWSAVLQKSEWNQIFDKIATIPNFWQTLEPYQNNIRALGEFMENAKNIELYYVTARAKSAGLSIPKQTSLWLRDLDIFPFSNYHAVVPVKSSTEKPAVMKALEITHSVDDYGPTVVACSAEVPGHQAFVLDRAWNRDKNYGPRVNSLEEFLVKFYTAN